MSYQKNGRAAAPKTPRRQRTGSHSGMPATLLLTFCCGAGTGLLLLAFEAFLFERLPLSRALVRPAALMAAAAAACMAGLVFAARVGQKKLLCGLGCGGFVCVCLCTASLLRGGVSFTGSNMFLLATVLLAGTAGGAAAAMRTPSAGVHSARTR